MSTTRPRGTRRALWLLFLALGAALWLLAHNQWTAHESLAFAALWTVWGALNIPFARQGG
jgi:hypothetical protein